MKRKILIITAIVLALLGVGGYFIYQMMMGPMYLPGDLTSKEEYKQFLEANPIKKQNFFELNDSISLYYEKQGTGKTPVLIIHGGPAIPYEKPWNGLEGLTGDYTFYYYHQRGAGQSSRPFDKFESSNFFQNALALNKTLGIPAQVADIELLRKALGQEKIILIGHSFGGFLATMYAIEFPERVQSLVLVAPAEVIKLPSEGGGLYEAVRERLPENLQADYSNYLEQVFDFKNLFKKSEQELVNQNLEFIQYYEAATQQSIEVKPENIGGWMSQALYLGMGVQHDYSEYLKQITAPTLVVHGTDDILGQKSVQLYLDHIPKTELKTISGSHFMFYDNPIKFGEIVSSFLSKPQE